MYSTYNAKYPCLIVRNQKLDCGVCKNFLKLLTYKTQGIRLSPEWLECDVNAYVVTNKDKRQYLRKKIYKHKNSDS
jgi:hypothetical protein